MKLAQALDVVSNLIAGVGQSKDFVRIIGDGATVRLAAMTNQIRLDVRADCDCSKVDAVVSTKRLRSAISPLGDSIKITSTKSGIKIKGEGAITIASAIGVEIDTFDASPANAVSVNGPALRSALSRLMPYAHKGEDRPQVQGVLISADGRAVATDSRRLAYAACPDGLSVNLPRQAVGLTLATKGDSFTVSVTSDSVIVSDGSVTFSSQLTSQPADFPPYAAILPKTKTACTIARASLLSAIAVAATAINEHGGVLLETANGELRVSASDGANSAEHSISCIGDLAETAISCSMLVDACKFFSESDEIVIHGCGDALSPVVFAGSQPIERDLALVMPMKK